MEAQFFPKGLDFFQEAHDHADGGPVHLVLLTQLFDLTQARDGIFVEVPGALEIPQALGKAVEAGAMTTASKQGRYSGVVVLGCVIRGETSHYDIVCNNANHWMMDVAMRHGIPLGNAILTVDTHEQAMVRASGGRKGKGADAARACLRLVEIATQFSELET